MTIRRALGALTALAVLAPLVTLAPRSEASPTSQPRVVVALADSGINPYHEVYRRPDLTAHPCTYVEGYDDCSIPALHLTLGGNDYAAARTADAAVWGSLVEGQWYWIPGTNIIGVVCDGSQDTCIIDDNGHGTGTSSNVLSEEPDALIMMHEGLGAGLLDEAPVTPDIFSYSVGSLAPLPTQVVDPLVPGEAGCGQLPPDRDTIMFRSAGNNAPIPSIIDCIRMYPHMQTVGGGYPSPAYASSQSYSVYDFASWFCRPAARHNSVTAERSSYCGTSFATPTAAGAAAKALLELRRREGYTGGSHAGMVTPSISQERFIDGLRAAATYQPQAKYPNRGSIIDMPVPQHAPWLLWGYGWLDSTVSDAVVDCVVGGPCPAKSAEADAWNAGRREVRRRTTEDLRPVPTRPQDDAGSGADAPDTFAGAVPVASGVAHEGYADVYDEDVDLYRIDTTAGDDLELRATASLYGRFEVLDAAGTSLTVLWCDGQLPCATSVDAVPGGGLFLRVEAFSAPQAYGFALGVGEPAPQPAPAL